MSTLLDHWRRLLRRDTTLPMRPATAPTGTLRLWDHVIGFVIALATLFTLVSTPDMGFTRDEGFYFHAAHDYLGWFEELETNLEKDDVDASFTQEGIDKHWSYNPEHPVLLKTSFALSYRAFSQDRDWLSPSTAMRLPTMVFIAALMWMMFLFMAEAFDRVAGVFACLALISQPRFFFHAHLSCFDAAMVTMWFAVIWAYWKSLESRTWVVLCGIIWGISLGTKLNAFFLPGVLAIHWALNGWAEFRLRRQLEPTPSGRGERRVLMLSMPRVPAAFFSMILIGPVLFYLMWPRHWFDTFGRIYWYIDRHLSHEHYAVYYFGELLALPPFPREFPYVMSLLTVPVVTLMAFAVGVLALLASASLRARARFVVARARSVFTGEQAVRTYAWDRRGTVLLMALGCWIPFFIISRPDTPIFGGTKHWSTAMPFLACFAGIGFSWAVGRLLVWFATLRGPARRAFAVLQRPLARSGVMLCLTPLVLWPAIRDTVHLHPFGTSYYNELIGGVAGAADAGMHRQFWGYASREGLDWLNEHAPENARVHWHNTLAYAYDMYKEDGLLREDIGVAWDLPSARYVMYHHQRAFHPFKYEIWATYGTTSPIYVVSVDGVPVLSIYENPSAAR